MTWEYQTVSRNLTTVELNEYGAQGWELVQVADRGPLTIHWFKRPRPDTQASAAEPYNWRAGWQHWDGL